MSYDPERLYNLLPTVYRLRDLEQGGPLRALMAVLAEQVAVLEEDLAQLYDDQFIETCAEWALPYISDLIGYRALYGVTPQVSNPRAEVANTIGYRRRKGTAAMLEQVARDVTGWPARVVEFFQLLATTQYMNHLRPGNLATPDLRRIEPLERSNTPFDPLAHRVDVRRIASGRGRYNIPNVGIFLWRLRAYPITKGTARQVQSGLGCYTFNPLGFDAPLFNAPRTEDEITHIAEPVNVPEPLRRRPLYAELEAQRQGLANGLSVADVTRRGVYFGTQPVLAVFKVQAGTSTSIPSRQIMICDLSDPPIPLASLWRRPPFDPSIPEEERPIRVAVDPVLGRLAFPDDPTLDRVEVSYAYGFSADIGGGPYPRSELPLPNLNLPINPGDALAALNSLGTASRIVELPSSLTLDGNITITLGAGQRLRIQAENGERPVLNGVLSVAAAANAELILDGLLITQGIVVTGTATTTLVLRDCTIPPWLEMDAGRPKAPTTPAIDWSADAAQGTLHLLRTISGRLRLGPGIEVRAEDSIVDALRDDGIALAASDDGTTEAGQLTMRTSTLIGGLHVREIELIENSIITGRAVSNRKQAGCVRFSYLPPDSDVPRRYQCQPNRAIQQAVDAARQEQPTISTEQQQAVEGGVLARVKPIFTDSYYGGAGYMQLALSCPSEICTGADDGSEMGAFHDLYQARRETNLRIRLDEYLRFGLEAGILYAT